MNQQPQPPQSNYQASDEIDVFELFQMLWQEKVLIVVIGAVVTGLALLYALTAKPVYQAQASLVAPPAYAVQDYNEGQIFKVFGVDEVYSVFKNNLNSLQLRTDFLEKVYAPLFSSEDKKLSRDVLMKRLNSTLTVKKSSNNSDSYSVTAEMDDPVVAAELVNKYIDYAISAAKYELRNNIEAERRVHINTLSLKIKSLINTAREEREDQIKLLKEALLVAESIGLDNPSQLSDKASLGGNRYIDNDLIYTRGAKTLRAQLAVLEQRTSDEPFIEGFRTLNMQLQTLRNYKLNDSNVSVVLIDEPAEIPSTPIKPRKSLIVAVGIIFGGMLGIVAALIRSMIRKRRKIAL